jgi:hypothetical protein
MLRLRGLLNLNVPHLTSFAQYIKPSPQIDPYDAEDIFNVLNSCAHFLTLNSMFQIRKQKSLDKVKYSVLIDGPGIL